MVSQRLPNWVTKHLFTYDPAAVPADRIADLRTKLNQFKTDAPEVSIVIPAYNEEKNILNTLSSLAEQRLRVPTELIIVNNNSKDRTQELLDAVGVSSYFEKKPGVGQARQSGMDVARGKFIINGDSDCIYPPGWSEALSNPLRDPANAITSGTYAFLPNPIMSRLSLSIYEVVVRWANLIRKRSRPYLYVYGFNFAVRRDDAQAVGGYPVDSGYKGSAEEHFASGENTLIEWASEDGWMAVQLVENGKGQIHSVPGPDALVWASSRRLAGEGSLTNALMTRLKKARREMSS